MRKPAAVLLIAAVSCFAQMSMPDPAPHQAAIKKLQFLSGKWEGSGWIQMGPEKHTFKQTENIRLRLSETMLTIEGLGIDDGGKPVHQAMAIVTWDARANEYRMRAYSYPGRVTDADVRLEGQTFEWTMKVGPMSMKYTIAVAPDGKWIETGEMTRDGQTWQKFFEMNLRRVGDPS